MLLLLHFPDLLLSSVSYHIWLFRRQHGADQSLELQKDLPAVRSEMVSWISEVAFRSGDCGVWFGNRAFRSAPLYCGQRTGACLWSGCARLFYVPFSEIQIRADPAPCVCARTSVCGIWPQGEGLLSQRWRLPQ